MSDVSFHFSELTTVLDSAGEIIAGLLLAAFVIKRGAPRVLVPLRRLHTGSSNDYAMFSAVGLVVSMVTLVLI